MGLDQVLAIFFSFVIGVIFGGMAALLSRGMVANRQIRIAQKSAAKIVDAARTEAKGVLNEARGEINRAKGVTDSEYRERRTELQRQENRLSQKEATLEHKLADAEQREQKLAGKEREV